MSDITEPRIKTKYNYLSLGAGVQSSCLAFMAEKGEITPKPDFAVFADTQAEPQEVYDYLEYLKANLSYPVFTVTEGNLEAEAAEIKTATDKAKSYNKGDKYCMLNIPAFGKLPDGSVSAAIGRKCTADYKIKPIHKFVKKHYDINPRKKDAVNIVTQYIGISWDEMQRIKSSRFKWLVHRHPLIEKQMRREDCIKWMRANNYEEPPRSACYFCPFHDNKEWRYLRDNCPEEFSRAIKFDKDIRELSEKYPHTKMQIYLHRSCIPLGEIDFDNDEDKGQGIFDFQSECEGMCGV